MPPYDGVAESCVKPAWILLSAALCFQGSAFAQEKPALPKVDLAAITARGHALFEYDQAAALGTDAIFALKPDPKGLAHYVCTRTPSGWVISVFRWNESHDQLLVVYEAQEKGGKFVARKLDKPVPADSGLLAKERALETATADFPRPNRRYNMAVLPASDGNLYVYLYPGQTREDVWPLGGDIRYTISSDGKTIVEKRRLHNALRDNVIRSNQKAGYHLHDVTDVPEDTDVFFVLNRKPPMPEIIGTSKQLYAIDKEGNIEIGNK
jgi:hypothetical protein